MSEFEIAERKLEFQRWWRDNLKRLEWHLLPTLYQGRVHELMKRAYYAGSNSERKKHELVRTGGYV